ncbi:MAG: DEAD/DEAH box helicase, partial [Thermoplasmata archaeon]
MGAVRRALVRYSYEDVLGMLDPLVAKWFRSRFSDLTEPQAYAIPLIAEGKNVLVSSPTGTGKTLTAFLWIISELVSMGRRGELEDRIYAVYVSPLRALANDIRRNLLQPLEEMKALDPDMPEVRVAVRTGDTPQSERAKMLRRPPHIFITTPESLSLALSAPKFRMAFRGVRWV